MAQALVESLIYNGLYTPAKSIGVEIDYINKTVIRRGNSDPTMFKMFTKRERVLVDDDGKILERANNVTGENMGDGSKGQVMVYQPKFYFMRLPLETSNNSINKEIIYLSDIP
jgi:hypothetical protein